MIENAELVMQMLEMYQMYKQQAPVELEEYLRYVAKTGNTLFQWTLVKPFIREKILNVIAEFAEQSALADIPPYPNVDPFNYEAMKTLLLERFDAFNGPPFTIQRLCELLSCPRKEYNRVDKFMRAVEKNILVVSTCELRSRREETAVVNGVVDRWENCKEPDVNMDPVDKSAVIADAGVLNGSESVESLLNELESMKTPEAKLDESTVVDGKEDCVTQITGEVESNFVAEPPADAVSTPDTPQTHVSELINPVDVTHGPVVDATIETNPEASEIAPVEIKEQIAGNVIEELKNLSSDTSLENVKPNIEEPIIESNNLEVSEQASEPIPTDTDRVEGSIIHQTPDSDNKVELVTEALQPEMMVEKSDESIESMDVQVETEVETVTKALEPEVSCDNIPEECTEPIKIENEVHKNDESTIHATPAVDPIPTEMDFEPEKVENNDITQQETIPVNEEIKATKPDNILEKPQGQDENKQTESE